MPGCHVSTKTIGHTIRSFADDVSIVNLRLPSAQLRRGSQPICQIDYSA